MSDVPEQSRSVPEFEHGAVSSVLEKLPAEFREHLDRCIVDREPPTYRGIYEQFGLVNEGISFSAFWRYARRLRGSADMASLAELALPADAELPAVLPRLLAQHLFSVIAAEQASPRALRDLVDCYRLTTLTQMAMEERERKQCLKEIKEARAAAHRHVQECAEVAEITRKHCEGLRAEPKNSG